MGRKDRISKGVHSIYIKYIVLKVRVRSIRAPKDSQGKEIFSLNLMLVSRNPDSKGEQMRWCIGYLLLLIWF